MLKQLCKYSKVFLDARGDLEIIYEKNSFVLKRSLSRKGTFRGLHYQKKPYEQTKIIRVVSGLITDFVSQPDDVEQVVWYKKISPSDGWFLVENSLAHGFFANEETTFEYICIGEYSESSEQTLNISKIFKKYFIEENLILSDKDKNGADYGKRLIEIVES